jgi:hypothetical protein
MVTSLLVLVAGTTHATRALGLALLISSSGIAIGLFVDYTALFCDADMQAVCTTQAALVYFGALAAAFWTFIVALTTLLAPRDGASQTKVAIVVSHLVAWLVPLLGLILAAATDHFRYSHYDAARFCFVDSADTIAWPWVLFFGPAMLLAAMSLVASVVLCVRRRGQHVAMALFVALFALLLLLWAIMRILLDVAGTPSERIGDASGTLADGETLWHIGAIAAALLGVVLIILLIDIVVERVRARGPKKSSDGLDIKAQDVLSDRNKTAKELTTQKDVYEVDAIISDSDEESLSIRVLDAAESDSHEPPPPQVQSSTLKSPREQVIYGTLPNHAPTPSSPRAPIIYDRAMPVSPRTTNLFDEAVVDLSSTSSSYSLSSTTSTSGSSSSSRSNSFSESRSPDLRPGSMSNSDDDLIVSPSRGNTSIAPRGDANAIESIIDELAAFDDEDES